MIRTRAVHRDGPPRLPSHSKHTKKADSPIRVGIVGLGRAGFGMQTQELLARPDTYEIVAGCDLSPRQRRRFKGKVPGAAVYARAEDLFADPASNSFRSPRGRRRTRRSPSRRSAPESS